MNTWTPQRAGKSLCVQSQKAIITQKTITYSINDYGQNKNNDEYSAHTYNQAYHEFFRPKVQFFCLPMYNNVNHQCHHMDDNEVITVYLELIKLASFKGPI